MKFLFVLLLLVALTDVNLTQAKPEPKPLPGLLGGAAPRPSHKHTELTRQREADNTEAHQEETSVVNDDGSFKDESHSDFTHVHEKKKSHESNDVKVDVTLEKGLTVSKIHKRESEANKTSESHSEDQTWTQDGASEASNSTHAQTSKREVEEDREDYNVSLLGVTSTKTKTEDTVEDSESRKESSSHARSHTDAADTESRQTKVEHDKSHDETHKTTTKTESVLDAKKGAGGVFGAVGARKGSPGSGQEKKVTEKTTESKKSSKSRDVQEESEQTEVIREPVAGGPA